MFLSGNDWKGTNMDAFTCAALITLAFAIGAGAGSILTLNWIRQGGLYEEGFRYSYFWDNKKRSKFRRM